MTVSELRKALDEMEKVGLGDEEIVVCDRETGDLSRLVDINMVRELNFKVIAEYEGFEV